ncbi:MAG: amidase [Gemmatimonadota bacterium]|nr:amidase [Gemmatimonadota bacterium]
MTNDRTTYRDQHSDALDRRGFMAYFAGLGLGGTALPTALWTVAQDQGSKITKDMLAHAEAVAGLSFTDAEREMVVDGLNTNLEAYKRLRAVTVPNTIHPALTFDPVLPGRTPQVRERVSRYTQHSDIKRPARLEDVAFWPLTQLGELVRTRQVSSVELTRMYLDRLARYGARLECVISVTDELAMRQARRADAELATGVYRGPLHGIPWGAKDLLAEDEYRTTWGAKPYQDQRLPFDATVVRRLEEAGAVLIAKLTLGALAMGDVWYGGRTRNPWNLEQGSSGSSAGSASATVAGLVGFSIGSETLGSIVSPSTRCGATGLRPTFGRVSRYGSMALSWSMDKLGPICRTVEDCALVFDAIHGADGKDPTARELPFTWDVELPLRELRIGYYRKAFEEEHRGAEFDATALEAIRGLGVKLTPVALPEDYPVSSLRIILNAEAAAAFDDLTRSDRDDLLVRQTSNAWPNSFRRSRFIPAVEYIQANRVRTMLMGAMEHTLGGIDVFITPSYGGDVLLTTNLTGHPAVTLPSGFRDDGTPVSISFVGRLFGESELLTVAKAFQDATGHHLRRPPEFT